MGNVSGNLPPQVQDLANRGKSAWRGASGGQKVVAVIVGAVVVIGLFFGISQCSHNQKIRSDCARMVDREFNYKGKNRDDAIDFCVRYTKDFGATE